MAAKKYLTGILLALGIVGFVGFVGCVWFIYEVIQDPEGVQVVIDSPSRVTVDEDFAFTVVVQNQRPDKAFSLGEIDIADSYFDSFVLVGVDPPARSSEHIPIDNTRSFSFDQDIPPGESASFVFTLRAPAPGIFRGDVDVCEGQRFLSVLAQTEVRAADAAP